MIIMQIMTTYLTEYLIGKEKSASFEFPKSVKNKENYLNIFGNKITLVKMWRKDALKSFVDYINNFDEPEYKGFRDFEIILS